MVALSNSAASLCIYLCYASLPWHVLSTNTSVSNERSAFCRDNEGCAHLSGKCCPANDGMMLACCGASRPEPSPSTSPQPRGQCSSCLCVFDIDRTLTGKQGDIGACPNNRVLHGIWDSAYGGGPATLSKLSVVGISATFCGGCYLGICSAGIGSGEGSSWNQYIMDHIMRSVPQDSLVARDPSIKRWSYGTAVRSPYVLAQPNRRKHHAVAGIRAWYVQRGICIPEASVYFFGDHTENIPPFREYGFNSREISCASRDRSYHSRVGYCGAQPEEIQRVHGNSACGE